MTQKTLNVYLYDLKVGELLQGEAGRLSFRYSPGTPESYRLSYSMPVNDAIYEDRVCRAVFGGLLPEANERDRLADALGISKQNDFRMLEIIGGDCAGAVSFYHAGDTPQFSGTDHYLFGNFEHKLSNEELYNLFIRLKIKPMLIGDGIRISLAGAQRKIALIVENNNFYLPEKDKISTHILKPPHDRFKNMVENEFFCMNLFKQITLGPANFIDVKIKYLKPEYPILVVRRYDRTLDNRLFLFRRHQEDSCQALSVVAEQKYQSDQGPGFSELFGLTNKLCTGPAANIRNLLDMVCFNYLIGNHDAHGKNFSFLYENPYRDEEIDIWLAPPYDILCTAIYPGTTSKMAMKIGDEYEAENIFLRHWERFADECGLSGPYVVQTIHAMIKKINLAFPLLVNKLKEQGVNTDIFPQIWDVFQRRSKNISDF